MSQDKKSFTSSFIFKVFLVILVVLLSIFFIFGLIGRALYVLVKNQGKRVDKMMSKLIMARVITNEKDFKKVANYKSRVFFFHHSIAPILLLLCVFICYMVSMSLNGWQTSMFYLFGKMIYPWEGLPTYVPPLGFDFSNVTASYVDMSNWFSIMTLITIILLFIGLIWYFFNVSGYLARKYRINKLSNKMFSKNLDHIDLSTFLSPVNAPVLDTSKMEEEKGSNLPQSKINN